MTEHQTHPVATGDQGIHRCAHCHQPIRTSAPDPRWRAYCETCARHLAGRQKHPDSA